MTQEVAELKDCLLKNNQMNELFENGRCIHPPEAPRKEVLGSAEGSDFAPSLFFKAIEKVSSSEA